VIVQAAVVYFALVLARVATFVAVLPLLGGRQMPRSVKAGLALALTVMWSLAFFERLPLDPWLLQESGVVPWLGFGLALVREALLGAVVGYAFSLVLLPARIAGEFLAQEMGLSFGNLVSATGENVASPVAVLLEMLAAALFFSLDGHHVFLAVMHSTFLRFPLGEGLSLTPLAALVDGAALCHEDGLMLAAPAALVLFLITVVLLLLARAHPQLNLYTVGFPLRLGAGLVALLLLLPQGVAALISQFGQWSNYVGRLF
jgi:flagellar biosynthetic protein FliR